MPFEASGESFADSAACRARLVTMVAAARGEAFDAVEGPYEVAAGDVRIHMVRAEGAGHRITEQRCLAEKLSGRSWSHAMQDEEPEFTVESVARSAPWLKKDGAEQ
ncbi:hypothetical protein E2493_04195 [Sphingomonas parva]|uniref:Uncharacterized protein n=1 Tax=Sphingomonas parva TaxID=2555898 RepID=A0A4Y8ZU10_9SPHN|nr:hypothetical protein [Sphingomonas parva]TFI59404.1 hypothetical protein E2493_04195 [Sphingomonas parva]